MTLATAFFRAAPGWAVVIFCLLLAAVAIFEVLYRAGFTKTRFAPFMLGIPVPTNVGARLVTAQGPVPFASVAGTRNGAAIDRDANFGGASTGWGMAQSCVLQAAVGIALGTPTSFTFNAKLQDSDDGTTGWADYTDPSTGAAAAISPVATTGDGTGTLREKDVNLAGAKRYIRVVETAAFVGGTSPSIPTASIVTLGGFPVDPVN